MSRRQRNDDARRQPADPIRYRRTWRETRDDKCPTCGGPFWSTDIDIRPHRAVISTRSGGWVRSQVANTPDRPLRLYGTIRKRTRSFTRGRTWESCPDAFHVKDRLGQEAKEVPLLGVAIPKKDLPAKRKAKTLRQRERQGKDRR